MTQRIDNPGPDERVCFNCEHVVWAVALGLGVRCRHPDNSPPGGPEYQIPSRRHTCEHFEPAATARTARRPPR